MFSIKPKASWSFSGAGGNHLMQASCPGSEEQVWEPPANGPLCSGLALGMCILQMWNLEKSQFSQHLPNIYINKDDISVF